MRKLFLTCLLFAYAATSTAQLSKRSLEIKQKAGTLPPHAHISIVREHAPEQFGEFLSHDETGLTFFDIDHKSEVRLDYSQIRKLKNGYGGPNHLTRTHTDHTKGLIITLAVIGGLAVLIAAAAAAQ